MNKKDKDLYKRRIKNLEKAVMRLINEKFTIVFNAPDTHNTADFEIISPITNEEIMDFHHYLKTIKDFSELTKGGEDV